MTARIGFFLFQILSAAAAILWVFANPEARRNTLFLFSMGLLTNLVLYGWLGDRAWKHRPKDEDEWFPLLKSLAKHVFLLTAGTYLLVLVYYLGSGDEFAWIRTWVTASRIYMSAYIFAVAGFVIGALLGYGAHRRYKGFGQAEGREA
jgi:hypothetical protein